MSDSIHAMVRQIAHHARHASKAVATASAEEKSSALRAIARILLESRAALSEANRRDLNEATELSDAMRDRLAITDSHIDGMAQGLREIAAAPDIVGVISGVKQRPSGIRVGKMRVPIGVIAVIYESRPNVTADAMGVCLKAGNAVILRGGSEAMHTNRAIAHCIAEGLAEAMLPEKAVQLLPTTDRAAVGALLEMNEYIDLIVPRGGRSLIERVSKESTIPVLKHLDGICHVYIDAGASLSKAVDISVNAKVHRYGVCNAMETLLVDRTIAPEVLPRIAEMMRKHGVELHACESAIQWLMPAIPATEEDWKTEYLAPVLAIRVVDGVDGAIDHIERYGSHHTDTIVTENQATARRFLREVDSGTVMVNASTRFADGFEFGLGAEIGISTDKLHARGPVGVEGLTSEKFVVFGDGHVRA